MAKYLSGRSKKTPQSKLPADRYKYLSVGDAEPNFGDPVSPGDAVPSGQQYQVVSIEGFPGERYWVPIGGGLIPGSITVFDENILVGGISSTTQLNFTGAAITAFGINSPIPGIGVTIKVFAPGNNQEILFNTNNDFSTSSKFKFDSSLGLLSAGDRINVGIGGTVITTTGVGSVGIGTTNPTQELHVQGDLRLTGTIYDYLNRPGNEGEILVKTNNTFNGLSWINQSSVRSGAGGTYTNIQYHGSTGLVDGASNFVFDNVNSRIGIGSTTPNFLLDVVGYSSFKGQTDIDNLRVGVATIGTLGVTGLATTKDLIVTGISTIGTLGVTGLATTKDLIVTGISTIGTLGVTGLATTRFLNVTGVATIGTLGVTGITTTKDLIVTGVTTIGTLGVTGITTTKDLIVTGVTTVGFLTGKDAFYSGIVTAQKFDGKIVTLEESIETKSINVTGIGTIVNLNATNLNVSGITTTKNLNVTGIATIENLKVGVATIGNIEISKLSNRITTTTGNLILDSVGGTTQINDSVYINDATQSTDKDTGALIVEGGVGIEKNLNVGGNVGLGTSSSNTVSFTSRVSSNILPSTNNLNLGSTSNRWGTVFADKFDGAVVGVADTATTVGVGTTTGNGNYFLTFVDSNNSASSRTGEFLYSDDGISYNPFTDSLGIGTINPIHKLQVNDTFSTNIYSNRTYRTDANIPIGVAIGVDYFPSYTTPGTQTSYAIANNSTITGNIIAGSTNNGYIRAGNDVAIRGRTTTDNGTLVELTGRRIAVGHWHNVPIVVNPITTNAYGIIVDGLCNNGTITNIYGIYIPPIQKLEGASVINAYGIYSSIQSTDATNSSYNLYISGSAQNFISGNLGIGITNPTSKLQVAGNITPSVTNTYDLGTSSLKWNNVYANTFNGSFIGNADTTSQVSTGTTTGTTSYYLTFVNSNNSTRQNEFLYTDDGISYNPSTNSLGIGTANPGEKLQVDGNIRVGGSNTSNYIAFRGTVNDDQVPYTNTYIGERIYQTGSERSELVLFKGNDVNPGSGYDRIRLIGSELRFDTYASSIEVTGAFPSGSFEDVCSSSLVTNKMILTYDGNLGVGTINPTSKLQVAGNITPSVPNTYDLGTSSLKWNNVYANNFNGTFVGVADSAKQLQTPRNIAITGDLSWNVNFDGSVNVSSGSTLSNTGVIAGTYGSSTQVGQFTVDSKGRITSASNIGIDFTNASVSRASYADNSGISTNLKGGSAAQIPYQTGPSVTGFIPNGTSGQLLQSNGTSAPSWVSPGTLTADKANQVSTGTTTGTTSYYLTFVDSNNSTRQNEFLYTDDGISYNPSTNSLGIGTENPTSKLQVAGNITPSVTDTYDLGSNTLRWNNIYVKNINGTATGFVTSINVEQINYGCSNPISVITSSGITTIGIGTTSNAYGRKFIQSTEPTNVCDGDIWYDIGATNIVKTYTLDAVDSGNNVILRLSDGATNDDVLITAGSNINIDPVSAGGFSISANLSNIINDSFTLSTIPFFRNTSTINQNYTVQSKDFNEMTIGPTTINTGVTVTVNVDASWIIL